MGKALLVAHREFVENIRTKGFWIGILMMPVMLVLIGIIPLVVESTREAKRFAVVDRSGWLLPVVRQEIEITDMAYYLQEPTDPNIRRPLDVLKENLSGLSTKQINAIAHDLVNPNATQASRQLDLPEIVSDHISKHRYDIGRWWRSLSEKEKAGLSSNISRNFYLLVDEAPKDIAGLNEAIQTENLFAYFVIGEDPVVDSEGSRYVSNNLTDRDLLNWLSDIITKHIRKTRLESENLDPVIAAWINQPLVFKGLQITEGGLEESVDTRDVVRQWAPVVFVYLLWISILINTQMLLTNTIEEKSNKLIEVLLSSISPITLMAGKIMGIAATGLTIIFSWALMSFAFFFILPTVIGIQLPVDLGIAASDPWFLASFLIYFLLGYLLYAAILVGLGSVCNTLKEAQNLMLPVQLVQMLPILLMVPIGRDPNGTLAQILSYVPPLTPFVMMNRAAGPPTTFEYVSTTLLLLVSIFVALWLASKIFRIGILLTGKPPGPMEILRWLKTPDSDRSSVQ